jgi:hypothetical protein
MVMRSTPAVTRPTSSPIAAARSDGRGMMRSRSVPSAAWRVVEIGASVVAGQVVTGDATKP